MEDADLGALPDVPRTDSNWVFWCIGADVSWARIDRRIDESVPSPRCAFDFQWLIAA